MSKIHLEDESNPWIKKSEKIVYDNPWIIVREHQVIDPSGKDTIYGVVSAKHLAIGIIPLDEAYNTWLVGQFRYPHGKYSWEIVEGGGKLNVNPVESAMRELKEETGLQAREYIKILEMQTSNCILDEVAVIYVAKGITEGIASPDDDERLQIAKLPFSEAYRMVMEGRIQDSLSVGGILKAHLLMQEGKI
ncbi:MAG TPA: NUDIX hydrolase [Chitinophagales bacterium]|nr:NUDIX hydrolase [Chitinophagales bacterium]